MLRTKIHIVFSAVGAILGLSAFVCFCIVYANIEAGMWALLSGELFAVLRTNSAILQCCFQNYDLFWLLDIIEHMLKKQVHCNQNLLFDRLTIF